MASAIHRLDHRRGESLDVAVGHADDVEAPAVGHVDGMVVAQLVHLLLGSAAASRTCRTGGRYRPGAGRRRRSVARTAIDARRASRRARPASRARSSAIVEDDPHRRGAMIGRHRPHFARILERRGPSPRASSPSPRVLIHKRADAVAIDAEILVAALGDDDFVAGVDQPAQPRRILVEPAAEALIGDVDERDQPALDHRSRDLAPLVDVEVGAGRIVAAAVQQDDVARPAPPSASIIASKRMTRLAALVIRIIDRSRARRRRRSAHGWARSACR